MSIAPRIPFIAADAGGADTHDDAAPGRASRAAAPVPLLAGRIGMSLVIAGGAPAGAARR